MGGATADVNLITQKLQGSHLIVALFEHALTPQSNRAQRLLPQLTKGRLIQPTDKLSLLCLWHIF